MSKHKLKGPPIHKIADYYSELLMCCVYRFFQELNGQLFRTVSDASSSEDHVLTVEMVESLGLHAVQDAYFLTELAQVYGFNITVQRPMDMFSCCL